MTHIFYILISIMTVMELMKFSAADQLYKRMSEYRHIDQLEALRYLKAHPTFLAVNFYEMFGLTVMFAGLACSQWPCFLVVLLLSFSRFQRLGAWAVRFDCMFTVAIFIFAIINKYHLHLNWAQVITGIIN